MKQIIDPKYYYKLCNIYEREVEQPTGERVWLDASFYGGFRKWVKEKYNITNNGSTILTFEDDRDYTMFMLGWS